MRIVSELCASPQPSSPNSEFRILTPARMSEPNPQPLSRRPVLMPALVEAAFDYLMPEGTETGALVEATLAGRTLVGVVWEREVRGQGSEVRESTVPTAKLKPVLRVLDLPPRDDAFRRWIDWISDYTLAPKGAVLSLCALQYAAKTTRKKYHAEPFTFRLPELSESQRHVAQQLVERMGQPKPILLDGVTGSGKTEVYFHAMAAVLAGSRFQVPGKHWKLKPGTRNLARKSSSSSRRSPSPTNGSHGSRRRLAPRPSSGIRG